MSTTTPSTRPHAAWRRWPAGSLLEGSCLPVPEVGDVQAAASSGQAHENWAQNRFEDLGAAGGAR